MWRAETGSHAPASLSTRIPLDERSEDLPRHGEGILPARFGRLCLARAGAPRAARCRAWRDRDEVS